MNPTAYAEGAKLQFSNTSVVMVDPPETMFGYFYFSHMIPPFRPETMLVLGYGNGTIAELTRKIWGPQIKVTGVDTERRDYKYVEYKMHIMDAKDFVWDCTKWPIKKRFDYIVVDVSTGAYVPPFVYDIEFAARLSEMTKKLLSVNIPAKSIFKCDGYHKYFDFDKHDLVEANEVLFWSAKK